jgi:peptidoglycan/xylan/chitin deacetylase (PgdA/CDA1 family)
MNTRSSALVISLDFELFWGVLGAQSLAAYGGHVRGEWEAVPRMLALFRRYGVRASWATVGMLMCRDYEHWRSLCPAPRPGYRQAALSPYAWDATVKRHPELFFARPLVERILETPGQELATHTYSHFYCGEQGATARQFAADLACACELASDFGVRCQSLVFPRNQVAEAYLEVLPRFGIRAYRGNPDHFLYRRGDAVRGGVFGRAARFADGCLPVSGSQTAHAARCGKLINVPASLFLYPYSGRLRALAPLRLARLKQAMSAAARSGGMFHLWWHPHNFGVETEKNLALLESLLRHYRLLADGFGMRSCGIGDMARLVAANEQAHAPARTPTGAAEPVAGGLP